MHLYPEVDINLIRGNTYVTGRADYLLCHEDSEHGIESTLIAIEAKRPVDYSASHHQMAAYLAAIQDCRAQSAKPHPIAFGITTDSALFTFYFLDSQRRLSCSGQFDWRREKVKIIAWIDKILADAIKASPLTTPVLRRNLSLRNWERDFRRRQLLSSGSDDSLLAEGLPLAISAPDSSQVVGTVWYRTGQVLVVEYNEYDEDGEDGEEVKMSDKDDEEVELSDKEDYAVKD